MGRFVAGQGRDRRRARRSRPSSPDKLAWTTRQPVGVVGMITPWNFPVAIPSWKIFPALLAGNGIVLKPSEHGAACAERVRRVRCVEAGVPAALVQVVHGHGRAGRGARRAPRRRRGQLHRLGARPGARWRPARHGGRARSSCRSSSAARTPWSCCADADLDLVVDGALFGAFGTAGQRCTSTSRLDRPPRPSPTSSSSGIAERAERRSCLGDPTRRRRPTSARSSTAAPPDRILGWSSRSRAEQGADGRDRRRAVVEVERLRGRHVRRSRRSCRRRPRPPHRPQTRCSGRSSRCSRSTTSTRRSRSSTTSSTGCRPRSTRATSTPRSGPSITSTPGIVYVNAPTIGAEIPLPFGGTKHTGNGFREAGTRGIEQFSQVEDRLRRLLGPAAEGPDRQPPRRWRTRDEHALDRASRPAPPTGSPATRRGAGRRAVRGHFDIVAGRGRGLVAHRRRRAALPRPRVGHRGHQRRATAIPRVVAAAEAQLAPLMHTSVVTHHQRNIELAERLGAPVPVPRRARRCSSATPGAEAVDGAHQAGPPRDGSAGDHRLPRRRSTAARSAATSLTTAKGKYRAGYEPLLGGVTIAPYAYPLRYGGDEAAAAAALDALDELLALQAPPSTVAAMIVEPVLGEGGYVRPRSRGSRACASGATSTASCSCSTRCRRGIGRTGRPFAAETLRRRARCRAVRQGRSPAGSAARRASSPIATVFDALADGHPRHDVRRQSRCRARPRSRRSTFSNAKAVMPRASRLGEHALDAAQRGLGCRRPGCRPDDRGRARGQSVRSCGATSLLRRRRTRCSRVDRTRTPCGSHPRSPSRMRSGISDSTC